MRTALNPLVDRDLAFQKNRHAADLVSSWGLQMLNQSQFHMLRNSIGSLTTIIAVRRHDGEYGLR